MTTNRERLQRALTNGDPLYPHQGGDGKFTLSDSLGRPWSPDTFDTEEEAYAAIERMAQQAP